MHRPDRLNLAIATRCFVACKGCYAYFGGAEPDLNAIVSSVSRFVELGVNQVTISGGDPLTIDGLFDFLAALYDTGITSLKVDTVGTNLLNRTVTDGRFSHRYLDQLMKRVDYVGIPLDGWSNESYLLFRAGRPALYDETIELLDAIDNLGLPPNIIINTVAHKDNLIGLPAILSELVRHRSVFFWNIFQYTSTDQTTPYINGSFAAADAEFLAACDRVAAAAEPYGKLSLEISYRTIQSRLGEYLLVNSDGNCWLPDENGATIRLGSMFGREAEVLQQWSQMSDQLKARLVARPAR